MPEWTVVVGRAEHEIRVDEDPKSGKAFVRVDGRVAARPMSPDDESCDVPVGDATYRVMRHATDGFAIDLLPRASRDATVEPVKAKKSKRSWLVPVLVAVVALVSLDLWRIGVFASYDSIRWKPYHGDEFSISFPYKPNVESRSRGDVITTRFKKHLYMLQYGNLSNPINRFGSARLMSDLLDETAKAENGRIVSKSTEDWMGHPSIAYVIDVPPAGDHGFGRETGRIVMSSFKRFYQFFTFVPPEDSTTDTDRFLASFQIPDEAPAAPEPSAAPVATAKTLQFGRFDGATQTAGQPKQPPPPAPPTVIAPSWSNTTTH